MCALFAGKRVFLVCHIAVSRWGVGDGVHNCTSSGHCIFLPYFNTGVNVCCNVKHRASVRMPSSAYCTACLGNGLLLVAVLALAKTTFAFF